jgi:hypothetical protein
MLNEKQIILLHDFATSVANKYGVLSINDIDIEKIDPQLDGINRDGILKAILQMQDRRFIVADDKIYTTQKPKDQLDKIFSCYDEYGKPENITFSDVKSYLNIEALPITEGLKNLKNYCVDKSSLDDKIEKAYRFNWTFYFSANGITLSNYDQLSPYVSQYFGIEDNDELKKLCINALEMQVSWMCAGKTGKDNKYGVWFSKAAKKASCSVLDVYSVHNFCQSASNYYGYILIRDAYRIYKNLNRDQNFLSKEQFNTICDVAAETYSIYQIDGALVSVYLMEEASLQYWSEKTKADFLAEDKSRGEVDTLYLSILLLIREQSNRQFFVPTLDEFAPYQSPTYVEATTPYNKLVSLVSKDNENFNILLFNRDFNFYSNMVCEDVSKLRADTLEHLGIQKLDEIDKMIGIKLLEQAIDEVPCWSLRGLSQKEGKKRK